MRHRMSLFHTLSLLYLRKNARYTAVLIILVLTLMAFLFTMEIGYQKLGRREGLGIEKYQVNVVLNGYTGVRLPNENNDNQGSKNENILSMPDSETKNIEELTLENKDTVLYSMSKKPARLLDEVPPYNVQRTMIENPYEVTNAFHKASREISALNFTFPTISSSTFTSNENIQPTDSTSKDVKGKCTPVENVIFLKTHKTGSSTIINIMQRYADTHNLKVALPNKKHFLGWPNTFRDKYVFEHTKGDKYNIICNHARFHKQRMLKLMSNKNTKIVTITRDPLYQFESTAVYLNFYGLFKINRKLNLLDAFFNKSSEEIFNRTKKRNTHNIFLVKNPVAYDLGHPTWKESDSVVNETVEKVKADFDLVMISDYMAESLVMLKDLLCWDLKDVLYFTMNKRPERLRQKLSNIQETRNKVRRWNKIDDKIFQHFNTTFWGKVRKGGPRFQEDVEKLKKGNAWLEEKCLRKGRHFDKSQPWFPILGFRLSDESRNFKYRSLCERMIRSEIDYTNLLKLKQTTHGWIVPTATVKKKNKKQKKMEKEREVHRVNITVKDLTNQQIDEKIRTVEPPPPPV